MFSLGIYIYSIFYKNYRNKECFLNLRFHFSWHITHLVSNIPSANLEIPGGPCSIILFITKFPCVLFSGILAFLYQLLFLLLSFNKVPFSLVAKYQNVFFILRFFCYSEDKEISSILSNQLTIQFITTTRNLGNHVDNWNCS